MKSFETYGGKIPAVETSNLSGWLIVIGLGTTFAGSATVLTAPRSPVIISPLASFLIRCTPSRLMCRSCGVAWILTSLRMTSPLVFSRVAFA